MGETALDEQIFEEYLAEMRDHYTADKVCGSILPRPFPRSPHPVSIISWVMTISMHICDTMAAHSFMMLFPGRLQLQLFHERLYRFFDRRIDPAMDQRRVSPRLL
jgi:hypothetical protein